jgi:hypothetical protein
MIHSLVRAFLRNAVRSWLGSSQFSWTRLPVANDSPHVHAPGHNPDRILITGDGASAGVGVLTHDLGLPGYLARNLSSITGRATDVDIVVSTQMTAVTCLTALQPVRLSRFDVILLSLGINEALDFVEPRDWAIDLGLLLDYIRDNSPAATRTVVLSVPDFGAKSRLPRYLRNAADRHAARLNRVSRAVVLDRSNVSFLTFVAGDYEESEGAHTYQRWAAAIAPGLSEFLLVRPGEAPRAESMHESERQRALDDFGALDMAPDRILDEIATLAKDRQFLASAIGVPADDIPRVDAFCDITIRRPEHFVIEDTLLDPRYADNPVVRNPPHVRFYAGYPIETPDGHRIGSLCIMDIRPRTFTSKDATLLRDLAHRAQDRLWALSDDDLPIVPV